jgi:hypothetical protein
VHDDGELMASCLVVRDGGSGGGIRRSGVCAGQDGAREDFDVRPGKREDRKGGPRAGLRAPSPSQS